MARVGYCRVCGGTTLNTNVHSECELASLYDLLYRIQKYIKDHPEHSLKDSLVKEVLAGSFQSKKDHQNLKRDQQDRENRKRLWELDKQQYLQDALRKFENKNPDPDPKLY